MRINAKCGRRSAECKPQGAGLLGQSSNFKFQVSSLNGRVRQRAYLLTEALVYIGVVFVVLGVGYTALYHYIDHSVVLRQGADDITAALRAGERWRADVRSANRGIHTENTLTEQVLHLEGNRASVDYRYSADVVYRRFGSGTWTRMLNNVSTSSMQADLRQGVSAWRWELELKPRHKASAPASRIRPLFTFLAVPQPVSGK